jgi:hypothetical protein
MIPMGILLNDGITAELTFPFFNGIATIGRSCQLHRKYNASQIANSQRCKAFPTQFAYSERIPRSLTCLSNLSCNNLPPLITLRSFRPPGISSMAGRDARRSHHSQVGSMLDVDEGFRPGTSGIVVCQKCRMKRMSSPDAASCII